MMAPSVELGFLEKTESWKLHSRLFPSKVGGKPAWLSLKLLPTCEDLTCDKCHKVMVFLCQVYAPYENEGRDRDDDQILERNFHRTIFVFICPNAGCSECNNTQNIKIYRNSLAKINDFYPKDPPKEKWDPNSTMQLSQLCNLCGIYAEKKCSKCQNVFYCCKDHQILDWKGSHKFQCTLNNEVISSPGLNFLFSEWGLVTEMEEIPVRPVIEEQAISDYKRYEAEGKTGTFDESELERYVSLQVDKVFGKFKKVIADYPDQVIRYNRGGEPLFIAKEPLPSYIPDCEYCGSPRQFEFQIMPQLLCELKEHDLDWGVLLIYTCTKSCRGNSINSYKKEFVFKQDVSNVNV